MKKKLAKVVFVLFTIPFILLGVLAAFVVAGYEVGTMIFNDVLKALED